MQNRLKQLPLNVQKRVYEIAGMETGTICSDWSSTEYNRALGVFERRRTRASLEL